MSGIIDVSCDTCGDDTFRLRRVDEYQTATDSVIVFCAGCGAATGKFAHKF
jgi:uncharacterized Zn finger protein